MVINLRMQLVYDTFFQQNLIETRRFKPVQNGILLKQKDINHYLPMLVKIAALLLMWMPAHLATENCIYLRKMKSPKDY